eukprot:g39831.t1
MCPVQQHKYGEPQDGQEQGDLESQFEIPHGTQQLRAMVAHVEKVTDKGGPSVHFMEVEQLGEINGYYDAEMAQLLLFSLDSRLFAAVQEEILEAMAEHLTSLSKAVEISQKHFYTLEQTTGKIGREITELTAQSWWNL